MSYNPTGKTVCCVACGRDTRARDGVCVECKGDENSIDNRTLRGRVVLTATTKTEEGKTGNVQMDLVDVNDPSLTNIVEEYHGDTSRDDL